MTQRNTVVGAFEDRLRAQQAINELKRAGFAERQIGVTARDEQDRADRTDGEKRGTHAGEGATAGLAAGAGVGALWGLGVIAGMLPAIGPAIAGGTLAAILSSAGAGAAAAGIGGALIGLGIPEDEAQEYENEFRAGRAIVTVQAEGRAEEARAILQRYGGYDASTRPTGRLGTGTAAGAAQRGETASPRARTAGAQEDTRTIRAQEEELRVHKEPVRTGEVDVRKEVHTEHRTIDVPVRKEEVVIERRPVHGEAAAGDGTLGKEEHIRVPLSEERVEVEKRPVTKEEVTVGKRTTEKEQRVTGDVRKEEIRVEKQGSPEVKSTKKRG